ncbi:baseplate J/gp47 family protein [Haladaptatus sp. DFWS20]|uniref:baseplate J/gp47 family protein n=1 Tax=Haladaptatus sp. DFWS20 TaxID=3403467 RepID=UPI003EB78A82
MSERPIVDSRDGNDLLEQARDIAPYYTEQWDPDADDVGATLLTLFSGMGEDVLERLNRVPEKHRIGFFDSLGFGRNPPQPSRLPVSFQVTADVEENVAISEGTQTVAPAKGERPEQLFEILAGDGFEGTPASIEAVVTTDPVNDDIFAHLDALESGVETELFTGTDRQEHALYVGHVDLLTLKSESKIWVTIETDTQSVQSEVFTDRLKWDFYGETEEDGVKSEGWKRITSISTSKVSGTTVTVDLTLPKETTETTEREVAGTKSKWIRCRIPFDAELLAESKSYAPQDLFGVEVKSVRLSLVPPKGGTGTVERILPDDLLSGDVPLEVTSDDQETGKEEPAELYPFGESWPLRSTLYVGSEEVFTKGSVMAEMTFIPSGRKVGETATEPDVSIPEQVSNGMVVTADSVAIPADEFPNGAFVGLDSDDPNELLGESQYLDSGVYEGVEITLKEELVARDGETTTDAHLFHATPDRTLGARFEDESWDVTFTTMPKEWPEPQISWEYWNGEGWALLDDLEDDTRDLRRSGSVSFTIPDDFEPTTAAGHEGFWIRAKLVSGEYLRLTYSEADAIAGKTATSIVGTPPRFGGTWLSYDSREEDLLTKDAETLVTQNNLNYEDVTATLDGEPSPSVKPFFGLPESEQTLYVGFDRELRDGPLNLFFSLTDEEYPSGFHPRVRWEYRNRLGDEWILLDTTDGTESLTEQGIVSFRFEEPTTPSTEFGEELHWIRARVDGQAFLPEVDTGKLPDPTALPVEVLRIDSVDQRVVLLNAGTQVINLAGYRIKFACARPDDRVRTFRKDTTVAPGRPLTIATSSDPADEGVVHFDFDHPALDECATNAVTIETPDGELVTTKVEGVPDPCEQRLATVPPAGTPDRTPPKLSGLHINTGWVYNVERIEGEILGSSDGTQSQTFIVATPPVTEEAVWVNELPVLSEGERQTLLETHPDAVEEVTSADDQTIAFWVRWGPVDDFLESGNDDRHYQMNATSGRLTFGNGVHGRIPPQGVDNLRIDYRTGGGVWGNVETAAVTDLLSLIPFVDSVTNPEPGDGGADSELLAGVLTRAPKELRDRGKAVAKEDFERVAMAASRQLARAKCIPAMDEMGEYSPGWVTVLIVPNDQREKPVPSVELKHRVTGGVSDRAPATLVAADRVRSGNDAVSVPELVVRGPSYVEVSVTTTIEAGSVGSISTLEADIRDQLSGFLHPLTGSETGVGWEFGELPCLSDFYALLEGIDGVDHVADLSVTFRGDDETRTVTEGEQPPNVAVDVLVYSGAHVVTVDGMSADTDTEGK